jgi:putative addiction module killer protein
MNMRWELLKTTEFIEWYQGLDQHQQRMVDARLLRVQMENHFGTVRRFDGLTELKWKSGLRVYTAEKRPDLIILLGGNKNGQSKDIRNAKKILREIDQA